MYCIVGGIALSRKLLMEGQEKSRLKTIITKIVFSLLFSLSRESRVERVAKIDNPLDYFPGLLLCRGGV